MDRLFIRLALKRAHYFQGIVIGCDGFDFHFVCRACGVGKRKCRVIEDKR
jgi:hypothetical protein